jgi:hypothetical protein
VVDVYSFDVSNEPRLAFSHSIGESVSAVDVGLFSSHAHDDVMVATYAGKIISFSPDHDALDV